MKDFELKDHIPYGFGDLTPSTRRAILVKLLTPSHSPAAYLGTYKIPRPDKGEFSTSIFDLAVCTARGLPRNSSWPERTARNSGAFVRDAS